MRRCPISYEALSPEEEVKGNYSRKGLSLLSPRLASLAHLPYSAEAMRIEAASRAEKMSVQGVQPKLSARLDVKRTRFEIVDIKGSYILKPPLADFQNVPQNEDLSMRLAKAANIEVPLHGLIYAADDSLVYFIKRFDRYGHNTKRMQEDFAQLCGRSRDTKYDSSMEQVAAIIDEHCTFPVVEKLKLFRRTLFCFLIGNEDMHLKNFSLQSYDRNIVLTPVYDMLSTTLVLPNVKEELALPLNGKKRNLTRNDFLHYFGQKRLSLTPAAIGEVLSTFAAAFPKWEVLIKSSFLPQVLQESYSKLIAERRQFLGL